MQIREYRVGKRGIKIILLADLHNRPYEHVLTCVEKQRPDIIAVAGDMTYGFDQYDKVSSFLTACGDIAPTCFSLGNHDSADSIKQLDVGRALLLDDEYMDTHIRGAELRIAGLTSPVLHTYRNRAYARLSDRERPRRSEVNIAWLSDFCDTPAYKILLCHQPEFYPLYLKGLPIDLVFSGHAHGGQWRIPFTQQGVFSPGQGLFPKLTGGVVDGRLVISRGLSNTVWIPRFFNPREIVAVEL